MLKKLPFLLFVFALNLNAQTFLLSNENIFITPTVSSADVGDYDDDGDLDIILMGLVDGSISTQIYDNNGAGNFSLSTIDLGENYRNGQVEFLDYDNDNDLDVFISGLTLSGGKSRLYTNELGVFTEVPFVFGGDTINNQFCWGDLDNDGDLDLILMGNFQAMENYAYVYRNDGGGNFTSLTHSFLALSQGAIRMADLDNDGYNDVVVGGIQGEMAVVSYLEVYKNNGDFNFTQELSLEGFFNGDLELRDCNNDGLIDIIKNGTTDDGDATRMYLNSGDFEFSENVSVSFASVGDFANMVSADYDGNGELDFLVSGREQPYTELNFSTSIYANDGDLTLSENVTSGISNGSFNDIEIGDFDNDHDVDVFIMNGNACNTFSNKSTNENIIPNPPTGLSVEILENEVVLSWESGWDSESPIEQLSYNVYVGTITEGTDVVTPESNISSGYRKVVKLGNAQYKSQFSLLDLPDGTYYWAVQSIDNQYEGSEFSLENSFEVNSLGVNENVLSGSIRCFPNPVQNQLNIVSSRKIKQVNVYTTLGQELMSTNGSTLDVVIDFSAMKSGMYFVEIVCDDFSNYLQKVFKK
ncbi:T9SS type A sorting domain-containing protein [Mangrovimonas sp. YM274]|uniref:T9SS type A sorting domain-containing protein n=1 Tax=Mangrovimonas sp. YM274 TaxID=3070660 RepID=UPI0027DB97F4|nr:T9SS type A sorting domain-containing protein [Mangrovimonas sp. YM274]WMI68751.1 T9SS type A sorting domain-containing protein [Mangrovimonas sp. YM274]